MMSTLGCIVILSPLVASFITFLIKNPYKSFKVSGMLGCLIFILNCVLTFEIPKDNFILFYEVNYIQNVKIMGGLDIISKTFMDLTSLLIVFCILVIPRSIQMSYRNLYVLLFLIEFLLFMAFTSLDLMAFFISFETILIPFFFIINIWGSRNEKRSAAYRFFMYTIVGSSTMLFAIIYIYTITGTTNYLLLLNIKFDLKSELFLWICFFISFCVKIPSFPFHKWLVEAHVEAPTFGSVLLAGILLKLGSYGLIRFCLRLFPMASEYFLPFIYAISLYSIFFASIMIFAQTDLKKILAYSSVIHMNFATIGIFTPVLESFVGSLFLLISHGLVSPGLFFAVGVLYDRYHTRDISYYGGLVHIMPHFSRFFFLLILINMAFPLTCGFVGELGILMSVFKINIHVGLLLSPILLINAVWSYNFYSRICQGPVNICIKKFSDLNETEFLHTIMFMFIFISFWN